MSQDKYHYYHTIPENVPRIYSPLMDRLCRWVYHRMGWRFIGEMPNIKKAVVILAPHTSNWDFFLACVAKFALQLKASYIMKKEAFFWPFTNWLIKIGGIPIDRSQPTRIVPRVVERIQAEEKIWVVITPEGTRKKVSHFKTGFARIAHAAEVPIIVVALDFKKKAIIFAKVTEPTGNFEQDAQALYHYYRENFVGRRPENQ